jgi:hypothetical protein
VSLPGVDADVDFDVYINTLYALSISLAALLAVIKIVIAGIKWMLTDVVSSISEAKKDIQGALIGLLIIISAVLVLNVINPNLTKTELFFAPVPQSNITTRTPVATEPQSLYCSNEGIGPSSCSALEARCGGTITKKDRVFTGDGGNLNQFYVTCDQPFGPPVVAPPLVGGVDGGCNLVHPLIRPAGFTEHVRTWPQVFNGFEFPRTPSYAMPVGSFTVTGNPDTSPPSAGMYLAIPVTLAANHRLRFTTTLPGGTSRVGYNVSRKGNVFVSLSPCAGDLRPQDGAAADIFARSCRGILAENAITFSTKPGVGSCSVPAGDYWINIMHAIPSEAGFGPSSESCNPLDTQDPSARCESNFVVSYGPI